MSTVGAKINEFSTLGSVWYSTEYNKFTGERDQLSAEKEGLKARIIEIAEEEENKRKNIEFVSSDMTRNEKYVGN